MKKEDYQHWVKYIQRQYMQIPDFLIADQENWRNRSILARALTRQQQYEPARELFQTIVPIRPQRTGENGTKLSEIEDKAICLISLALLLQLELPYDQDEVRSYLEEVKRYLKQYPEEFQFFTVAEMEKEIETAVLRMKKEVTRA